MNIYIMTDIEGISYPITGDDVESTVFRANS